MAFNHNSLIKDDRTLCIFTVHEKNQNIAHIFDSKTTFRAKKLLYDKVFLSQKL